MQNMGGDKIHGVTLWHQCDICSKCLQTKSWGCVPLWMRILCIHTYYFFPIPKSLKSFSITRGSQGSSTSSDACFMATTIFYWSTIDLHYDTYIGAVLTRRAHLYLCTWLELLWNTGLCSCLSVSVSALQSVLPIGVWRVQRCYYVTTTPCCCRHFHTAFLRTARQSCSEWSLAMGRKSPRMHSIASFIHSTLSITLSVQWLCCYH